MQAATNKICIVLPTWVGDACMATPMLRAVRAAYPQAHIVGVMRPVIQDVLEDAWLSGPAWFDDVILINKHRSPHTTTRVGLIGELRKRRLDTAILLTNSLWSAAIAKMAGVNRIVGYNRDARRWFLTDPIAVPRDGKKLRPISPVDYYLQLADWMGCDTTDRRMQLAVGKRDRELANELWYQLGFSPLLPTIVINSGAAKAAARLWPASKVGELSRRIASELGWQVVLHCGPSDREITNSLAEELSHPRIGSMGVATELPIGLSKAVMEQATLVVSTDSGPRHLAVALDRPVVTLFGPTDPNWTITYNSPETTIAENVACRPCFKNTCPLQHHNCMQNLSVARVFDAVAWQAAYRNVAA